MARPKLGEGETERLHVKISEQELTAIDDWRYANRIPSRSEAVRRLVQVGLILDRHAWQLVEAASDITNDTAVLLSSPVEISQEEIAGSMLQSWEFALQTVGVMQSALSLRTGATLDEALNQVAATRDVFNKISRRYKGEAGE